MNDDIAFLESDYVSAEEAQWWAFRRELMGIRVKSSRDKFTCYEHAKSIAASMFADNRDYEQAIRLICEVLGV